MKKSIKLTLGLLGISTISAITVGSVISCSNNNTNLASNNNQDNKNSNNKSSSTNPNSSNDTSFIPYSELTKTVTKEPSFAAALANWTQRWKQLTSNRETYLKMITNDFNACLSDFTKFTNTNPFLYNIYQNTLYGYDWLINNSYSNIHISLNKDNTFNISYDCTTNIGYKNDNISHPNVIQVVSTNKYSDVNFKPCLLHLFNLKYLTTSNTQNFSFFCGEETNLGSCSYQLSLKILSNNFYDSSPDKAPECPGGEGNIKSVYSFINQEKSKNLKNINSPGLCPYYISDYIWPIFLGAIQRENGFFLISSYQNGINYGELSLQNNK